MELTRNSTLINKKFREFFIPTVLTNMSLTLSFVLNNIIVGNLLGPYQMASLNVVLPLIQLYTAIAILFGIGASLIMAIAKGERNNTYSDRIFTASILSILGISVIMTLLQHLFTDEILSTLTDNDTIYAYAKEFYKYLLWGTPFYIILLMITFCIRIDGWAKLSSLILITSNAVSIALNFILIKYFGFSLDAAGISMLTGYAVATLLLIPYVFSKARGIHLNLHFAHGIKEICKYTWSVTKQGFPAALGNSLIMLKILALNHITDNVDGNLGLVIFTVCISCWSFVSMAIAGSAQTMVPILATLYGEKDFKGVRIVFNTTLAVMLSLCAICILYMNIFPADVLNIFGVDSGYAVANGIPAIRIFSVSLLGTAVSFLFLYYYTTIGKRTLSIVISLCEGFLIIVPLAYILGRLFGITGVWYSFIICEILTIAIIYSYTRFTGRAGNKNTGYGIMQVPVRADGEILNLSVNGLAAYAGEVSDKIRKELVKNGADEITAREAYIVTEREMINICKTGKKGDSMNIDIRVCASEGNILILIRDNGCFRNTANDSIPYPEQIIPAGIEYNSVLGLNYTTITINK